MKQKLQRFVKNLLKVTAVACFLSSTTLLNAQTSITVENGDFQLPGTVKQTNWESVPGWNSDTPALDSGVEEPFGATIWTAFIKSQDPAVWNLTAHPVAEGEIYTLTLGWAWDIWATGSGFSVRLFYSDDAGLTRTTLGTAYTGFAYDGLQVIADGIAAPVGSMLGIEIDNIAPGDAWAGFDNVTLTYSSLSSNANLSSLGLSVGEQAAPLSSNVTSYFVSIPEGTLSVNVAPTLEDDGASILSGTGDIDITDGEGSTTIEVEAEDGTLKNYSLFFKVLTKMHSYDFETDYSDGTNSVDGIENGTPSIQCGALKLDSNGDYLSFDGAALDLNSYSAITMEYIFQDYTGSNTGWRWSSYFGGDGGTDAFFTGLSQWNTEFRCSYDGQEIFNNAVNHNDGNVHHIVAILTSTHITVYRDGALLSQVPNNNGFTIDSAQSFLGKGSDAWGDPTWEGLIYEFNIYNGVMDSGTVSAQYSGILLDQCITFDGPLPIKAIGDADFNLTATSSSNLTVSFSSSDPTVATVSGNTVTIVGEGTCNIIASQAGDAIFNAATDVMQSLTVNSVSSDADLSDISVSLGSLIPGFSAGTTSYGVSVPNGTTSVNVNATRNDAGASFTINGNPATDGVDEAIAISGGTGTATIEVTAEDESTTNTYTVNFVEECFMPTMETPNLVSNPSMGGDFAAQTGWNRGWTPFEPMSSEDACDDLTGSMYLKGDCYPNGGALYFESATAIIPGMGYRILAKFKNEQAANSDVFNIVLPNDVWNKEDTDSNGGTNQFLVGIPTGEGWVQFDQTIVAGPAATGPVNLLIMSCDSPEVGLDTDVLFIDHLEIYAVPSLSVKDFEARSFSLYPNPSNSGDFTIQLKSANVNGSVNVKVYSLLGKEILNQDFTPSAGKIDINQDLNSGLYLVKIDNKETTKLVVK
ncbi:cadherin-like beta sandwich domain-containing protein [Tamlana flava]|uniref:cadherin-like beta sandwich domain-containing protein n=1 Tax=Tamlana flava TaxID=3158572 RepID=UPI00351AF839